MKLEPCPFCGGTLLRIECCSACIFVTCDECDAEGPVVWIENGRPRTDPATIAEAVTLWNERTGTTL